MIKSWKKSQRWIISSVRFQGTENKPSDTLNYATGFQQKEAHPYATEGALETEMITGKNCQAQSPAQQESRDMAAAKPSPDRRAWEEGFSMHLIQAAPQLLFLLKSPEINVHVAPKVPVFPLS